MKIGFKNLEIAIWAIPIDDPSQYERVTDDRETDRPPVHSNIAERDKTESCNSVLIKIHFITGL